MHENQVHCFHFIEDCFMRVLSMTNISPIKILGILILFRNISFLLYYLFFLFFLKFGIYDQEKGNSTKLKKIFIRKSQNCFSHSECYIFFYSCSFFFFLIKCFTELIANQNSLKLKFRVRVLWRVKNNKKQLARNVAWF